jgi:hypothetical protein
MRHAGRGIRAAVDQKLPARFGDAKIEGVLPEPLGDELPHRDLVQHRVDAPERDEAHHRDTHVEAPPMLEGAGQDSEGAGL